MLAGTEGNGNALGQTYLSALLTVICPHIRPETASEVRFHLSTLRNSNCISRGAPSAPLSDVVGGITSISWGGEIPYNLTSKG